LTVVTGLDYLLLGVRHSTTPAPSKTTPPSPKAKPAAIP
jgi:hypothetical protein